MADKRGRATATETVAGLGREIEQLRGKIEQLERHGCHQLDLIRKHAGERDQLNEQITVLRSDRDRLTAALEVATRRLASPAADKDVSRGGWRYSNGTPARSQSINDCSFENSRG